MTRKEIIGSLKGIIPPLVTPFTRQGKIDEVLFRENLQKLTGIGLSGFLVAGSTGEAPYLTESERLRLVELARDVVRPPEIVMAGTGLESTQATVRLSQEAVARGADALLVLTPNYFKPRMDGDALVAHYQTVAGKVNRPVLVYLIPQFTGLHVEPATVGRLSQIPNLAGLKDSSGDFRFLRAMLKRVRPGFPVFTGAALIFYKALCAGAVGAVLGKATFAPELCLSLYQAFLNGRKKTALELQEKLSRLARTITIPYGIPGVKAALDFSGYGGGFPRAPLAPLETAHRKRVASALREFRVGLEY